MEKNYHLALLSLIHLLICADGEQHKMEIDALEIIREKEGIPDTTFDEFRKTILPKPEREIYQSGINYLSKCSEEEKINVFVTLYKLSEVDGRVHVKEIRLLLYSIKLTEIEFSDVVNRALATPPLL